jgi:formate hydrogenlyase transcriptional activator
MASAEEQPESLNIQLLVDSIPALIHTARPDGHLDYFNKHWLDYLGATLDEVAGWKWTAFVHPEDVDGIVAQWRACLATGEIFEYEARVCSANGEYRWMFHRKVPLRDANGNIVKWYGSSLDIEDRKQAEVLLSAEKRLLEMTATDVALERILNFLCLFIEEQRSGTLASVLLLNPDGVYLCFAAGPSIPNEWKQQMERLPIGPCAGSCGTAAFTRSPVIVSDIATDPLWEVPEHRASALKHGLRASWSSPVLSSKGKVLGTFCMYYREPRSPEAQDLELIESATHLVGVAIERDRAEQALRRSEAYLTEAQRLSHTGSFGWRPETGEIVWSDETYRIFEYDPAEKPTIGMVLQRTHPQDRALMQQVIETVSNSGTDFENGFRLLLPDGRVKYVHAVAHATQNASGNREIVGAVTDITERKTTEDKIRRLVEADILGVFMANVHGQIVEANQAFLQMLQYDHQDLVSGRLLWTDLTPAELRERDQRALTEAFADGVFQPYEKEFFRKDGSRVPVMIGGTLFQSANEGVVFVLDLSEQKRAEQKTREKEMELQQILDFTPQPLGVIGPREETIFANRALLNYFGLSLEEWQSQPAQTRFHPDDLEQIQWGPHGGPPDHYEARLRRYDGTYRWFLVYNNPLHDERGQITRWFVAGTDIEDRKRAEERLRQENVALREEIDKASMFEEIVGTSPALQAVLSRISKVAPGDSTVLITGETGTGKELVARAVHRRSNRASRAFVSVNCAAIPRELIASELFGHEKGAFTGATQQRLGRFELANGGTLFLDEVGELPAETQIALLRVLQEHEFERVGGTRPIRADVRVLAATNRELQAAISAGSFREDLFYRLNVFPIEVPPLRERKEDIRLLVEYFIDRYARKAGKNITSVEKKTLRLLESYPWPGNIRELQNVIERSVIVSETATFSVDESWLSQKPPERKAEGQLYLSEKMEAQEKEIIEAALRECQGRVFGSSGAAARLGIARSTLESKIRSLKINKNRFRA